MSQLTRAQRQKCISLLVAIKDIGSNATNEDLAQALKLSNRTAQRLVGLATKMNFISLTKPHTKNRTITISTNGESLMNHDDHRQNDRQNHRQSPIYISKKVKKEKKSFDIDNFEEDRRKWLASLMFRSAEELGNDERIAKILGMEQGEHISFPSLYQEEHKVYAYLYAAYQYSIYKGFSLMSLLFVLDEYRNDPYSFVVDVRALIANNWRSLTNAKQARLNCSSNNRKNHILENTALQQQKSSKEIGFRLQQSLTTSKKEVISKPSKADKNAIAFHTNIACLKQDLIKEFKRAVDLGLVKDDYFHLKLFVGALIRAEKTVKKNGGSPACLFSNTINNNNFKYVEESDLVEARRRIPGYVEASSEKIEFPIEVEPEMPRVRHAVVRTNNQEPNVDLSLLSEEERESLRIRAEESLAAFRGRFNQESFDAAVKLNMSTLAMKQYPMKYQID